MNVFGHSLGAEPADFKQHPAAEQPAASRKERAVMSVATGLEDAVEQRLLILQHSFELKILLKYIGVIEMMRRLDEGDQFILEKSYRVLQETAGRNMVDVENRNDFSRRL